MKDDAAARRIALEAAEIALTKKAEDVRVLQVGEFSSVTDYIVICTGRSDVQVRAVADALARGLKKRGARCHHVEGLSYGRWVLMDLFDVVVHVMLPEVREFYDLEGLWSDAPGRSFGESSRPLDDLETDWDVARAPAESRSVKSL